MNYVRTMKYHKSNLSVKSNRGSGAKKNYHCDFRGKDGHTKDYCYANPEFKKHKGKKQDERPKFKLHTTAIDKRRSINLLDDVILDSGATIYFLATKICSLVKLICIMVFLNVHQATRKFLEKEKSKFNR